MAAWKLILSYSLLVISLFVTPLAALAASPNIPTSTSSAALLPTTNYQLPTYIPPTSPLYTDLFVHNMFHSFSCLAIGQSVIGQPCLTYQITKNAQGMVQGIPILAQANLSGGALGAVTGVIGALYENPPVRTTDYLASVGQGLGIVKEANAQVVGSGAQVLSPILRLWQVSRNISYVLMIIIFLVIGLMVMFRNKLNPQTVITAQAALPGLVIGLVMITFSYFFAGLISDMAFVGTNVVGYYFVAAQGKLADNTFTGQLNLSQRISHSNVIQITGPFTNIINNEKISQFIDTLFTSLGDDAQQAVRMLVFWISAQFAANIIPDDLLAGSAKLSPYSMLIKPISGLIIGGATSLFGISPILGRLLGFAAALALVYQMIKLLFKLITVWLTIIFLTITAPFQFLIASLPGRQGMATGWIMNMLGNILVFPAIIAVLYFVAFLLRSDANFQEKCLKDNKGCILRVSQANQINNSSFVSPVYAEGNTDIIGTDTFPLFGNIPLDFVKYLLAFGALMALPAIPDIVTRTVGKAGQAGSMIGQEIMGGARFGQGYSQRSYTSGLEIGQQVKTGITGQTTIDAQGQLVVSKPGFIRETGPVGGPARGTGRFVRPKWPF